MGLVGGVFAPALFLGACTGVLLGVFIKTILPETNIILYAVSAMAAVGSCVIGGPVANMMIIFELTQDYQATLAAGISIVFASIISFKLIGQSVFDKVLLNRKIDLKIGRDHLFLMEKKVGEIMQKKSCNIIGDLQITSAINKMIKEDFSESYHLDKYGKLMNKFELTYLLTLKSTKKISALPKKKFLIVKTNESILEAIEKCKDFVGESIPIVDENMILKGIITESDLFKSFLETSESVHKLEVKD